MHRTNLLGTVNSADPGSMVLDLAAIGPHRAAAYDFAGTGQTPQQDAVASNYEVNTGVLDVSRFNPGSPARVIGFVTPFGSAPADFEARSIVDYESVPSILWLGWGKNGSSSAFLSMDGTSLVIDNVNTAIGARHFLTTGPVRVDVKSLATAPQIVPKSSDLGLYAIGQPGSVEVFGDFADFTAALAQKISGGQRVVGLTAAGQFETSTSVLSSGRVTVSLTRN
jgi:hypothetical protein